MQTRGSHLRRRVWWERWWIVAGALALVVGGIAAALAVSSGPSAAQKAAKKAEQAARVAAAQHAATLAAETQLASGLSISPVNATTGVPLDSHVTVRTTEGTIASVRVASTGGSAVAGTLNATRTLWSSTGALQPTSTYRVQAVISNGNGIRVTKSSTFSTLTPTYQITASVFPSDGTTVGVGQPIVVNFNYNVRTIAGQKAVLSHIKVSMSNPVPGGWYWFSMSELHFRPETYWPTGEHVTVTGDLNGWNAGLNRWGSGSFESTFSIGDSHVAVANLATDEMTVTDNGKVIATYPISGGRAQYPTMGGTHIVLDKESVVHMVSSTVGIPVNSPNGYDEYVYNDVHISDSGEYVHDAPWSVGSQGVTNVSHGCINLGPSESLTFFNFSQVGDVVEVTGSPRPPVPGDHGVMDWTTPWSQWTPAHVYQLT